MMIKSPTIEDLKNIELLNQMQGDFKLNDIRNCIIDKIVYENGDVVAYGIVKRMAEAVLLTNPNMSKLSRAKAMRELMQYAEMGAKREGCAQLHCFVKNPELSETLKNKFGFIESQDIVLAKDL